MARMYSIVVPAHNEARYLGKTLRSLAALDYPDFEVIVVENGSTDRTCAAAKPFASKKIRVYSLKRKGVSAARNFGASKTSPRAEWIIFLDADTRLGAAFLRELDAFLSRPGGDRLAVGTTRVLPDDRSAASAAWFHLFNLGHRLTKTSFSIQIVRRRHFAKVKYDERLTQSEDLKMIKGMRRYGRFFYLQTMAVRTSTRRFKKVGWGKVLVGWVIQGVLAPERARRRFRYRVVR